MVTETNYGKALEKHLSSLYKATIDGVKKTKTLKEKLWKKYSPAVPMAEGEYAMVTIDKVQTLGYYKMRDGPFTNPGSSLKLGGGSKYLELP